MARGVRKTPMEKLKDELTEVQNSIQKYKENLEILQEKEKHLVERLELEEFKSLTNLLDEQGMSMEDLKVMIQANTPAEQSA